MSDFRRRKLILQLILFNLLLLSITSSVVAFERLTQSPPRITSSQLPEGIRTGLFEYVPGFSGVSTTGIRYSINDWGYRDDPVDLSKRHVVFVGDSTAFGVNLEHQDTFSEVWERVAGEDWQAVNISMLSNGTASEYAELRKLLTRDFQPEWIILCYHAKDSASGFWDNTTWESSERFLKLIHTLLNEHGIRLLLVYMPSGEDDIFNGSLSRDVILDFATNENIPLVDIVEVYREYLNAQNMTTIPAGFYSRPNDVAHPGVENSRLIGEAIAEVIP
jgi:hypothetical protein